MRGRGDIRDGAHLEPDRTERTNRGLTSRAGTLDENINTLHAVLHRAPTGGLGSHLSGERRRLARALEAHGARAGPRDDRTIGVGDGDDGVVERALDVGLSGDHILLFLAPHLRLGSGALSACSSHKSVVLLGRCLGEGLPRGVVGASHRNPRRVGSANHLLARDGLLLALAGAGVGASALTADG
ncbi:hypothetical protein SDC9_148034 [bioreactor metagenome]|uniref:Uncharacterized protein n=1 Tax=bioreactor metagenome TaxID=1076179 RepID=A0A645EHB0_9ZZZZ